MTRVVIPSAITSQKLVLTRPQWGILCSDDRIAKTVRAKVCAIGPSSCKEVWLTGAEIDALRMRMMVLSVNLYGSYRRVVNGIVMKLSGLRGRAMAFDRAAAGLRAGPTEAG